MSETRHITPSRPLEYPKLTPPTPQSVNLAGLLNMLRQQLPTHNPNRSFIEATVSQREASALALILDGIAEPALAILIRGFADIYHGRRVELLFTARELEHVIDLLDDIIYDSREEDTNEGI